MTLTRPPLLMIREYATPEAFGAVGDGSTSDQAAFAAMLASGIRTIIPDRTKLYTLTAPIVLPDDLAIEDNLRLRVAANAPAVDTPLITLGRRLTAPRRLHIEVAAGFQWGRLIQGTTIDRLRIGEVYMTSADQQESYIEPDWYNDGAMVLTGAVGMVDIGYWFCEKFDIIGRWRELNNVSVGAVNWTGFRKGLEVSSRTDGGRGARRLTIGSVYAVGDSPNCIGNPGENALILQGVEVAHIEKAVVKDTGEHGIRVTGDNNTGQGTYSLSMGAVQIYRPGACGLKLGVSTIDPQNWIDDVQIGALYVEDAGRNIDGLTGSAYLANNNHFGLFLDQVRRCQIGAYTTRKALNTYNGVHNLKLRNATDFTLGRSVLRDAAHDAIRIEDLADEPIIDGINLDAMCSRFARAGEGGAALRFFNVGGTVLDFRARLHISEGVDGVHASGLTGTIARPVLITGHHYGLTGSASVGATDPNLHIDLEAL